MEKNLTHVSQKAKPTTIQFPHSEERLWFPRDSVIGTSSQQIFGKNVKYDSDDQSSMVSEPGSPQALSQVSDGDVSMLSDDEDEQHQPSRSTRTPSRSGQGEAWRAQLQGRAGTPVHSPQMGQKVAPNHVRSRHPQEIMSSDRLEVPSPIDEDEVPTPPSAAEAAGSQLELLSVSDVEMQSIDDIPTIALHSDRSLQLDGGADNDNKLDRMDVKADNAIIRKTRARSGALSASGSPMRDSSPGDISYGARKGFSMGYRADCEKCRQRVPGHMNHLY